MQPHHCTLVALMPHISTSKWNVKLAVLGGGAQKLSAKVVNGKHTIGIWWLITFEPLELKQGQKPCFKVLLFNGVTVFLYYAVPIWK